MKTDCAPRVKPPQRYRYMGLIVVVRDGEVVPVLRGGQPIGLRRASKGLFPKLPNDLRWAVRRENERRRITERFDALNVKMPKRREPEPAAWTDLTGEAA